MFTFLCDGRCPTDDAVECLGTQVNNEKFFSFSENHCDLWNIQNIHMLHSRIGQVTFPDFCGKIT